MCQDAPLPHPEVLRDLLETLSAFLFADGLVDVLEYLLCHVLGPFYIVAIFSGVGIVDDLQPSAAVAPEAPYSADSPACTVVGIW